MLHELLLSLRDGQLRRHVAPSGRVPIHGDSASISRAAASGCVRGRSSAMNGLLIVIQGISISSFACSPARLFGARAHREASAPASCSRSVGSLSLCNNRNRSGNRSRRQLRHSDRTLSSRLLLILVS